MEPIVLNDQNFEKEVLESQIPVLVDFWAEWCGPCRLTGPIIDDLAKDYEGKVKVGKVDVDANPQTASKYGIMSIPTVALFKNKEIVKTMIGYQPKENFKKQIEESI